MTVKISAKYLGHKRVELLHNSSGSRIQTDAPTDNNGQGAFFSPTDLVAAGLGSCILTTMAILLEKDGIQIEPATIDLEKHMLSNPRRIGSIPITLRLSKNTPELQRAKIEQVAHSCPVHKSLHPDLKVDLTIVYDL